MKYVWSECDERYGSDEFDSREEALAAAREEEPGATIWTGVVVKLKLADGFPRHVEYCFWDTLEEQFFEEVGECGELRPKPSEEAWEDLRRRLNEWADAHDLHPKFFRVDDIVRHEPESD